MHIVFVRGLTPVFSQSVNVLFAFQPVYIPVCRLHKHVELSQLPEELGGSWSYNHNQWLQNRIVCGILLI
jgi:hypothetical protein